MPSHYHVCRSPILAPLSRFDAGPYLADQPSSRKLISATSIAFHFDKHLRKIQLLILYPQVPYLLFFMSVYYKWNASAAWTIAAQEEMCAFSDETGLREPIARKAFSLLRRFAGGLLNFLFLGGILKGLRGVS